jgi:cobalt-precorrin-7 (C5)-methyltransferase
MKIVGVGCGPGMLTCEAADVITAATQIVGSERAITLIKEYISPDCTVKVIEDYKTLKTLPDEAVLLSTGDPMMSGLGYLQGTVIPGISSVQLGAARLHIPLTKLMILSAHGRGHSKIVDTTADEIKQGKNVCLITDPDFSIPNLANYLIEFPETELIICQDIGYPSELIIRGTTQNPPEPSSGMYILFVIPPKPR